MHRFHHVTAVLGAPACKTGCNERLFCGINWRNTIYYQSDRRYIKHRGNKMQCCFEWNLSRRRPGASMCKQRTSKTRRRRFAAESNPSASILLCSCSPKRSARSSSRVRSARSTDIRWTRAVASDVALSQSGLLVIGEDRQAGVQEQWSGLEFATLESRTSCYAK
jgi:hypothetical protein